MKPALYALAICVSSAGLWAQSVIGSGVIGGQVTDADGQGMPDTELTLENQALGLTRVAESSIDGFFEFSGLPPAAGYHLRAVHKRYVNWEGPDFEVVLGRRDAVRIALQLEETAREKKLPAVPAPAGPGFAPVGAAIEGRLLDAPACSQPAVGDSLSTRPGGSRRTQPRRAGDARRHGFPGRVHRRHPH